MGRQLKYDQARLAVLKIIAENNLKPGDKLPAERQMLKFVDCSMITLRKALSVLEQEGMLEPLVGRGTFLKRSIHNGDKVGKILFINISDINHFCCPPPRGREYLQFYFAARGLDFQYIQVTKFSNYIINEADGALGILLFGWISEDFMKNISILKIPVVIIGNSRRYAGIPQVELDLVSCSEQVTSFLLKKGCRNLLFCNTSYDYYQAKDLEQGVKIAIRKCGDPEINLTQVNIGEQNRITLIDRELKNSKKYDAVIFELGIYYAFLAWCRLRHKNLSQPIGVFPRTADFIDSSTMFLTQASKDTIFGCFEQSIFEASSDMLIDHILNQKKLKTIKLKPEIDCGE